MKKLLFLICALSMVVSSAHSAVTLFGTNATWRYLKGTAEASSPDATAWRGLTYNDSAWLTGNGAFWYDTDTNPGTAFSGSTQLIDMQGGYTCIFLRKSFVITNTADVGIMTLSAFCDDGYIAWINGVEVARYNMPAGEVAFSGTSLAALAEPIPTVNQVTPNPASFLIAGTNVICVMAFNSSLAGSSDFVISTSLAYEPPDVTPPTLISKTPAPGTVGALNQINVQFSENVSGVTASDLLVNGSPATALTGSGSNYVFTFTQPPLGAVHVQFAADPGILDTGIPPNEFDETAPAASWDYTLVDNTPPTLATINPPPDSGVATLVQIEVLFSELVSGVDASDLLINGTPATSVDNVGPNQYVFTFAQPGTGTIQISWAANHGIQDAYANAFGAPTWTYTLDTRGPQVIINEFMADNKNTLNDEDGASSDWIELYNKSPYGVNLAGWYLTDTTNDLRKWQFPAVVMPTNSYLVVFASSKNKTSPTGRLHTNFKLSSGSSYLGLIYPDGTNVASEFAPAYPAQRQDISYGRDPFQPDLVGYFSSPSPGARNIPGGFGFAPDVVFSRNSSTFVAPFTLSLALETPASNTVIRYLVFTNAVGLTYTNVPTTNSPLYTGPILITNTTHIRARAFQTGALPGNPHSESYIALNTNALGFTSDLPIVILHNSGGGAVPSATDQFVMMQEFDPKDGKASITNAPDLTARGIFHLRGSSTLGIAKSSFHFESETEFGDARNISFAGLPEESDWVLYAPNNFEPVLIHNPTAYELSRQAGRYASRTRFVVVLLNTTGGAMSLPTFSSGHYNGIYVLEEKIKIDKNRVDIDKLEPENNTVPSVTGGYLLAIDRVPAGELQLNAGGQAMNWIVPHYSEMITPQRAPQLTYISNYFRDFGNALNGATWTNPVTGYAPYINADAWIDHGILNVVTFNVDALRLSGYFHKPRNGPITMGPVWDFDRTQGSTDSRDFNPRVFRSRVSDLGTDFFNPESNGVAWWGRLFHDPNFFQKWVDRYQYMRGNTLANSNVNAIIDGLAAQVRQEQPREQARWGWLPRTGAVTVDGFTFNFSGGYTGEVAWMKAWYSNRLDFIDTNFLARPVFSQNGGTIQAGFQLTLTPPAEAGSSMYYTLDGSDPRGLHGVVAPGAILYSGPITLNNNTRVIARSYNPNHRNLTGPNNPPISVPWSGPNEKTFVVHTPDLMITELMFHPGPLPPGNTNDVDLYEYIELKNVGTNNLNLVGFRFTNGIDFVFTTNSAVKTLAPGDYVLVVKNIAAFTSRYGARTNIAGEFAENLDNSGEHITLVGAAMETILDFVYNDSWYPLSDGIGFSLVPVDETTISGNLSTNTAWRISAVENGSPGLPNPTPVAAPVVLVNEALTHTDPPQIDTIELFNPNTNAVDISGWFLTDDFNRPRKYQIPASTVLQPGAFALFDESQFNLGPNGFALGSDGDQVFLFSGTNGLLTGFYHGFEFGPAQNGVSFGRYVNSQGTSYFVAQATNSLNGTNGLPMVGPVVISEIMYHPPDLLVGTNTVDNPIDEYIELLNIASTNVPLYHPQFTSNTWKLSKAVSFSFPTNVSLPPAGRALVVNFDSTDNALQLAFRQKYGVPPEVPVFGPYSGKLDNSGENIHLSRPDGPNGADVPFILVDRVDYSGSAPWPTIADGYGAALQRFVATDFGNDATNWYGARPTAGTASEGGAAPQILQQPQDTTAVEGTSASFSVNISSPTPLTYQWRFNGNPLRNENSSTLVLQGILPSQAGLYSVAVFNGGGSVISASGTLTIRPLPRITQQPLSQNVKPGTNFTISVSATGTGAIRYQWHFNGVDIPGATSPSILYTNAQLNTHAGYYDVTVTDDVSSINSQPAALVVLVPPVILVPPASIMVITGQTARFTVIATPDHPMLPLNIRWTRNSLPYNTNAPSTIVINNARTNGSFRATVSNLAGSALSSLVTLTIVGDSDHDGIADPWEIANGLNPGNASDGSADPDGDGMNNYQEYVAGTNPTNALSYLKLEPLQLLSGSNALLRFSAVTNRYYNLDYRDTLTSSWSSLLIAPVTNNRVLQVTNPLSGPMRFYRLGVPTD